MNLTKYTPKIIVRLISKPYGPAVIAFMGGAGLELFMNKFYIGEANIYKSIERNLSDEFAKNRFELEKCLAESQEGRDNDSI